MIAALMVVIMAAPPESTLWQAPPALSMNMEGLPLLRLPPELDDWVHDRLEAYRRYPAQCQLQLDGLKAAWGSFAEAQRLADRMAFVLETADIKIDRDTRWPTWALAGGIFLGVVVGAVLVLLGAELVSLAQPVSP